MFVNNTRSIFFFLFAYVCLVWWSIVPDYGINSILFQRGIYPPESFKTEEHFGLSILVSTDEKIQQFLQPVLNQMKGTLFILNWIIVYYIWALYKNLKSTFVLNVCYIKYSQCQFEPMAFKYKVLLKESKSL